MSTLDGMHLTRMCGLRRILKCHLNIRDGIRKAKVQMKLNLVEEVKNNKRSFRYIRQKRQEEESVPPLINEKGEVASKDMEKAEVLSEFFASVFTGTQAS